MERCRHELLNDNNKASSITKIFMHLGSGIHVHLSKAIIAASTEGMAGKMDCQVQGIGSSTLCTSHISEDGFSNLMQSITDNTGSPFYHSMKSIMSEELQLVEELEPGTHPLFEDDDQAKNEDHPMRPDHAMGEA